MILAEDDHVIEQFPSSASHEALGCSVLPGTLERRPFRMNPESWDGINNVQREDRFVVEKKIAMRREIRKGVAQLLNHPGS